MAEQRILVSDAELKPLAKRIASAIRAAQVAKAEAGIAADLFDLFCATRGLSDDVEFLRIEGNEIVVTVPTPKPDISPPPEG